jgi:acyl-CoA thioesterase-2
MSDALVEELVALLRLERLEDNLFRGESRDIGTHRVFGGQVLGQALSAAQQTVDPERGAHSLHAYFLRAGDIAKPIVYNVERARDGSSFSVRRVVAIQHGQPIFNCSVSFQIAEPGVEHQLPMPVVPKPDDLPSGPQIPPEQLALIPAKLQRWLTMRGPFEFRRVHPRDELNPGGTTTFPHGISYLQKNVQMASLDHALWFHRPFRVDEWLLYSCDSPTAQGARGLARGMIYAEDGRLIASTAQEGLIRLRAE